MSRVPFRSLTVLAAILVSLGVVSPVRAQSNWQPTAAGTYEWSNIANWAGGIPDSNTATANVIAALTGNQTINLGADRTLNVLNIGSAGGTYTLAGTQTLSFAGTTPAITMAAAAQNVFLNMNTLAVTADTVITNNSAAGTLNIGVAGTGQINNTTFGLTFGGAGNTVVNSVFSGTTGTITKTGAGTLTFTDANAFGSAHTQTVNGTVTTGNIAVNGGEMIVSEYSPNGRRHVRVTRERDERESEIGDRGEFLLHRQRDVIPRPE